MRKNRNCSVKERQDPEASVGIWTWGQGMQIITEGF